MDSKQKIVLVGLNLRICLFLIAAVFHFRVWGAEDTPKIPVPPSEHPRVFLRAKDIPQIRENCSSSELKETWEGILSRSKKKLQINGNKYDRGVIRGIQAKALVYVLENEPTLGKETVEVTQSYLSHLDFSKANGGTREIGEVIMTAAVVYDWCYSLMNKEQKLKTIQWVKNNAKHMEVGYPPLKQESFVGHAGEAQIFRDQLSAGIAFYDEDPEIYQYSAERILENEVAPRNWWYASGKHPMGDSYGNYRLSWELFAAWIFRRMGYEGVFSELQGTLPYHAIYTRRPDGLMMQEGDSGGTAHWKYGDYVTRPYESLYYAGNYYRDPYFKDEVLRENRLGRQGGKDEIFLILFGDPSTQAKPIQELPLTRYFGSPEGNLVARTGWDDGVVPDSPHVVAYMRVGEYRVGGHQHLDSGNFQIYYKGGLAVSGGAYFSGTYGTETDLNYNKRSISHNCLLVYDPNEDFGMGGSKHSEKLVNDGGQRFIKGMKELYSMDELKPGGERNVAKIEGHEFGPDKKEPDYSYLKGDLTRAYSSKISNYKRSFAFFNLKQEKHPAVMVVYDRVDVSNPAFKKYWLLHGVEEPKVEGNVSTFCRTEHKYNGKLINTTLFPEPDNLTIQKVGGKGNEMCVFGTNYFKKGPNTDDGGESIQWRIDVSPKKPSASDYFLNVMQVMDAKGTEAPLTIGKMESDTMLGATFSDRAVCFSKSGDRQREKLEINIPEGDANTKILICDLNEGQWKVSREEVEVGTFSASKDGGCIYFEGKPGHYIFSPITMSVDKGGS